MTIEIKTGKKNVVLRNAAGAQLKGATMSSKKKSIVPLLVVVSPPSDARLQFVSDRHVEDHHDPPAVHRVDLQFAIAHLADDPLSGSHLCVDGLRRDALFAIDLALHDGPIIPPSAIMIVAIETVLVEITSILKKRSCLLVTKNRPLFLACRQNSWLWPAKIPRSWELLHLISAVQSPCHLSLPHREVPLRPHLVLHPPIRSLGKWTVFKTNAIIADVTVHHRRPNVALSVRANANDTRIANLKGLESVSVLMSETEGIGFRIEIASVSVLPSGIDTVFRNAIAKRIDLEIAIGSERKIVLSPLNNTNLEGKPLLVDAAVVFHAHLHRSGKKPSPVPAVPEYSIIHEAQRQILKEIQRRTNVRN